MRYSLMMAAMLSACTGASEPDSASAAICEAYEACGEPWTPGQMDWCVAHTDAKASAGPCREALESATCDQLWAGDLPGGCL